MPHWASSFTFKNLRKKNHEPHEPHEREKKNNAGEYPMNKIGRSPSGFVVNFLFWNQFISSALVFRPDPGFAESCSAD
jgi:hypothetical protein